MANKRISELNELLSTQVAASDYFLVSDVSAFESKKITAANLRQYASFAGSYTGSFFGTSSWALNVKTASYLLYSGIPNGTASYSLYALHALSASYASRSLSSSYATSGLSSSYSLSSSFALRAITASYALTSSVLYVISSALAQQSQTASYVLYVPGFYNGRIVLADTASFLSYTGTNNGTASYAIRALTSSFVATSSFSRTSSFLRFDGVPNGTASWALASNISNGALTSSYLYLDPVSYTPNGSSSYAMTTNAYVDFGPYTASITNSNTASIKIIGLGPAYLNRTNFVIEFNGDIEMTYTGSASSSFEMSMSSVSLGYSADIMGGKSTSRMFTHPDISGSIRRDFFLKGSNTISSSTGYTASLYAYNSLFRTEERQVNVWIRGKFQDINVS